VKRWFASCAVLPAVLAAGCVQVCVDIEAPVDAVAVRTFVPGKTTAAEVTAQLGAPVDVVQIGLRSAYFYEATAAKTEAFYLLVFTISNTDRRSDRVWLFFDERDVLTDCGTTFATHRAQYAMPWQDVRDPAENARRDAARPGVLK
jgi:hypothetical protein